MIFFLSGRGDGRHRPAVKGVDQGNDFILLRTIFFVLIDSRQLDRSLICLRTAVGKENPICTTALYELFGQFSLRFHIIQIGGMGNMVL